MVKEGLENMKPTGHIEGKRNSRLRVSSLTSLCNWMDRRESKKENFAKNYKGQAIVESHDHQRPKGTR